MMNRIIILGSGGSGKSTLARKIGALLELEVIHLDSYYWLSGWVPTPDSEWTDKIKLLLDRDRWVMDGNYTSTLELRVSSADTVVFIDRSRWVCIWRCLKRLARYWGVSRPELAQGCYEKMDLEFLKWIWYYPVNVKPVIERTLAKYSEKQIIHLRTSKAVDAFLTQLKSESD